MEGREGSRGRVVVGGEKASGLRGISRPDGLDLVMNGSDVRDEGKGKPRVVPVSGLVTGCHYWNEKQVEGAN